MMDFWTTQLSLQAVETNVVFYGASIAAVRADEEHWPLTLALLREIGQVGALLGKRVVPVVELFDTKGNERKYPVIVEKDVF